MIILVDAGRPTEARAVVDDDLAPLAQYGWRFDRYGYVYRKNRGQRIYLHHAVIGRPAEGQVTDHINRDKLNNLRENLRHIARAVHAQNKGAQRRNKSGIRGAQLTKETGRWQAVVGVNGGRVRLGHYDTAEEAGRVASEYRAKHLPFSFEGRGASNPLGLPGKYRA